MRQPAESETIGSRAMGDVRDAAEWQLRHGEGAEAVRRRPVTSAGHRLAGACQAEQVLHTSWRRESDSCATDRRHLSVGSACGSGVRSMCPFSGRERRSARGTRARGEGKRERISAASLTQRAKGERDTHAAQRLRVRVWASRVNDSGKAGSIASRLPILPLEPVHMRCQ
jgi:hypothetical protein